MIATATVLSIPLVATYMCTGAGKLTGLKLLVQIAERIGVPDQLQKLIGILEIGGATGLLIGIRWHLLGAAAAAGLAALMIGAFAWHVRAKDVGRGLPAVVLGVLAAVVLVLRA